MKSEFVSGRTSVVVAAFASKEAARDAIDQLTGFDPAFIEYYDGDYFAVAATQGKKYEFSKGLDSPVSAVLLLGFDDFNERARHRKLKKANKQLEKSGATVQSAENETADELLAIRGVTAYSAIPLGKDTSAPPLFDNVYIPRERFEEFSTAVATLAAKHNVTLPLHGRVLDSIYSTRPTLQLHKVGDKQKIFRLLDEYSQLVDQFGGHLIADAGEGRVKARFAYTVLDDDVTKLFAAVKTIFDPYGVLNPGVKQSLDVRQLVSHLRADYDTASVPDHVPYN
jgi:FAD/FMN-containing dehydrogenase